MWLVTRYDDVLSGLRDPRLSSDPTDMYRQALPSAPRAQFQPLLDHISKWIQLTDEPDHSRLRKLVNLAFTPKMIASWGPQIGQLVAGLLDEMPTAPRSILSVRMAILSPRR
jgi:vitamin D3 1,25-hydroxylase